MKIHAKLFLLAALSLLCLLCLTCSRKRQPTLEAVDPIDRRTNVPLAAPIKRDLAEIKEGGTLTVLAPYNSTSYFVYRGEPLGYEYELLRTFAEEHGVALKMIVVTDAKSLLPLLNSGEGDIAAGRLIATPEDKANVSFSRALYRTEPALVQQESAPDTEQVKAQKKRLPQAPPMNCRKQISKRGLFFCRSIEPVNYVGLILGRFNHYKQFVVTAQHSSRKRMPLNYAWIRKGS